jgi:hypothetical protein
MGLEYHINRLILKQILKLSEGRLSVVQIHATIVAILIGIYGSYALYVHASVSGVKTTAIMEAEKINLAVFKKSFYFPPVGELPKTIEDSVKLARGLIDHLAYHEIIQRLPKMVQNEPKKPFNI